MKSPALFSWAVSPVLPVPVPWHIGECVGFRLQRHVAVVLTNSPPGMAADRIKNVLIDASLTPDRLEAVPPSVIWGDIANDPEVAYPHGEPLAGAGRTSRSYIRACRIVGWRASRTAHAGFVLDALEQALHDRRPAHGGGLVHHSDRGVQYVSIRYSERLAEAGIEPSVGSIGDSYDNALAETINGLYKAEVIHRRGPWKNFEAVEFATLEWVDWFNHQRLLEPIGNMPPAEAEERYYAMLDAPAMAA